MLYSEFIEGTGCKDNQHNYELYKNLEIMYMNSDLPKSTIYEYGKKLADNSKSEKEIEVENQIKAEIESLKEEMSQEKEWLEYYRVMDNKRMMRYYKDSIAAKRNRISTLKHWFLA